MNSPIEAAPAGLERRLLGAVAAYPFERTRFYQVLVSGRCPPALIRSYALATLRGAEDFRVKLARLTETAPDEEAHAILLENLREEDGVVVVGGKRVTRPARRHVALAQRFVAACGATEDMPAATHDDPAAALLDQGRWLEAVSFVLVGQEHPFSTVSARLFEALRGYGYSARDLVFFAAHRTADAEHGRQALALVGRHAAAPAQRDAAVAAAEAGARHWCARHGGLVPAGQAAAVW